MPWKSEGSCFVKIVFSAVKIDLLVAVEIEICREQLILPWHLWATVVRKVVFAYFPYKICVFV